MPDKIKPYRSSTPGAVPSLESGELAVNLADQKTYVGNGTSTVVVGCGLIFPDYSSPTSISINSTYQAPSNGYVTIAVTGLYRNGLYVYVGITPSCPYHICSMGDDINSYTKSSSFCFPIKEGSYYKLQPSSEGFEYITAYFWPAK